MMKSEFENLAGREHKGESDYQIHAYVDLGGENIADF